MEIGTPTPTPAEQVRSLARRLQWLLDEHGETMQTGLCLEFYTIAMKLHEQSADWVVRVVNEPIAGSERWFTDDMELCGDADDDSDGL